MADTSTNTTAKPGTACLGCRKRKLRCSREQEGCSNCLKSDLPCIYAAPDSGVKRKRGPYKKDKPARERHLEDLAKYLEPRPSQSDGRAPAVSPNGTSLGCGRGIPRRPAESKSNALNVTTESCSVNGVQLRREEDLVKDALVALSKSTAAGNDIATESEALASSSAVPVPFQPGRIGMHPPTRLIFEYWQLFVARVDPLLKIIHCPSFVKSLLKALDDLSSVDLATETLMLSIYYAVISSCTPREARQRFGESRTTLRHRFGRVIESALSDNYSMPTLGSLQALVIYIIAIRREDTISSLRALFSLAVRMAQLMGLQEDPADTMPLLEAELRRRLWWHICSLESRGAEESGSRASSIMEDGHVQLPSNYCDFDLEPGLHVRPQPRRGASDMLFFVLRCETMALMHTIWAIRKKQRTEGGAANDVQIKSKQRELLAEGKARIDAVHLRDLDESRPFDWLCVKFAEAILIKARLIIEHPFGQIPSNKMSKHERLSLLQDSVDIIRLTQSVSKGKGLDDWVWYFRGWTQWHSVAIIVAELCSSTNPQFAANAWSVLDPILADWDRVYEHKREEPAWDHVNTMIQRARDMRLHNPSSIEVSAKTPTQIKIQSKKPAVPAPPTIITIDQRTMAPHLQPLGFEVDTANGLQYQAQASHNIPSQTGCAPAMAGFDAGMGSFDNIGDIDFAAFDEVFGDITWENLSIDTDFSTEMLIT